MTRIAGACGPPGAAGPLLERMLTALGPAGGRVARDGVALAAAGAGAGGVAEADGLAVALDGRIYNRDELGVPGDDAQALAALARRHGVAGALARLNGDLACIVAEPATGRVWLGRDRLGARPLYWARSGAAVAAASRPRCLLRLPGAVVEPDPGWLARFAGSHYRVIDDAPDRSPYIGVQQVPAGCVVAIDGGSALVERYWHPPAGPDLDAPDEELAERYRDLLVDAVARRAATCAAPGFTLSGGMDSGSVLACAVRATGRRQQAWSTVYDDPTYDEREDIATILGDCVEDWRAVPIGTPDVLDVVAAMIAAHDEPVATATWLSHWVLAHAAADAGVDVLLGGLGGDELNAGEYEYFPFRFADMRAAGDEEGLAREVVAWAAHHDHAVFRKDRAVAEATMARLTDPAHPGVCLPDRARIERYADAVSPDLPPVRGFTPEMEHPFATCLMNRTWQDMTRETLPCCLRAGDRNAAAAGIERVEPFLDHRLVELMARVPGRLKIRDGVTKRLLRDAMRGVLPEATRTRVAKTGWNAPAHVWFSGRGGEALRDLVASRAFRERGVYVPEAVDRIVAEHEEIVASGEARENHMMFLWQLVNTELWLRDLDRERAAAA